MNSVVQAGSIISTINQSAESVSINADKINLSGNLSLTGDFTAYSSQLSNVSASVKDGTVSIFFNTQKMAEIDAMTDEGIFTGVIRFFDSSGNDLGRLTGQSLSVNSIIADHIAVNGSNETSKFYREVQFYGNVYNQSGGIQFISDRRKKRCIKDLAIEKAKSFLMALKPVKFKFIKKISESDRFHHGFIAQDVKEAMPDDWGLYTENKEQDFVGLRYDEFIADIVAVVQDQEKRIEALERALHDYTNNKS